MKLPACFGMVGWLFAFAFTQCTTPPNSQTPGQLYGEVHTELTAYRPDLINQPAPPYPGGPRGQRPQGTGVFRIKFDYNSGRAVAVTIVNSTGHVSLDQASVETLRDWTIKSRTWRNIDVLIRFAAAATNTVVSSGRRQFPVGAPASFRPPHSRPP